jgi:hypothetical protein
MVPPHRQPGSTTISLTHTDAAESYRRAQATAGKGVKPLP